MPLPCSEVFVKQLSHLRLDRQRLEELPAQVLSQLPNVTHLYVQHNRLTDMAPLKALRKLQFLAISHNRLTQVSSTRG